MRNALKLSYTLLVLLELVSSSLSANCRSNGTILKLQENKQWKDCLIRNKHPQSIAELHLERNNISEIDPAVFENLTFLSQLHLSDNLLKKINQSMFANFGKLDSLYLQHNRIEYIEPRTFMGLKSLKTLDLNQNLITRITKPMFANLSKLNNLYLQENGIENIADGAFDNLISLTVLNLMKNNLREIPRFTVLSSITTLRLSENPVQELRAEIMMKYQKLYSLYLEKTKIKEIPDNVFAGNLELYELYLTDGPLKTIKPRAFDGPSLTKLHLSGTMIDWLPDTGIQHLTELYIKNVKRLWQIPVVEFKRLQRANVTYQYHCCLIHSAYMDGSIGGMTPTAQSSVTVQPCVNNASTTSSPTSTTKPGTARFPNIKPLNPTNNVKLPTNTCIDPDATPVTPPRPKPVICDPKPDAFNPCDNVLGSHILRVFSWIVMVFAIIGNTAKILVLLFNKRPMTIYKILTLNLAFANWCMGLYLASLVAIDLHSYGVYQNYARAWQLGGGCQGVGFLSIFSTELAVYTLTVITVERYFMIVHPLDREKHLKRKQIVHLLLAGWVFSVVTASLPLFGISSYEKVAICLPFEVEGGLSRAYVTFLLATNGLAFFIVLFCYVRMYLSLGPGSPSAAAIELRVAKRMALLIFTNFACWFPIALLSLIAIYGHPLIDVKTSKFLLVFIYPINSFTNPYLYAIGTKSFQLDVLLILSKSKLCTEKIEERINRLHSKLDMAPTNSTRLSSNANSRLSLNSIRSNNNARLRRQKSSCSCIFICIHSKAYELRQMTPRGSPIMNGKAAPQGGESRSTSPEQFGRAGRPSSAKQIFMDEEAMSRYPPCRQDEQAKMFEEVDPPDENGRGEMPGCPLLGESCSKQLTQSSKQELQRKTDNGQVRSISIPMVHVTPC